jgi:NAD(P)-dependent dehydrogenase (short-subunit alcohol dehydrogenase family)
MKEFRGRIAVVTGAASGIGRALAERFAAEGMKVVLADIEEAALAKTEGELKAQGAAVLAVPTDVSKASQVDALARTTIDHFGAVHVLCNNAGVTGTFCPSWERTLGDWEWVLGVNLWGVIHGIHTFLPLMLEQGSEGHVVNTASMAGLVSLPGASGYGITKHGIVALSEALHHELTLSGAHVKVSVACPGWVNTQLADSERSRPAELQPDPDPPPQSPLWGAIEQRIRELIVAGLAPARVAECVLDAIRNERFYVLTHPEWNDLIRTRMSEIVEERNPTFSPPS